MKKLLTCSVGALAVLFSTSASAQYHDRFDRAGLFASMGVNNINNSVESKTGISKSLKGNMTVMPVIGGFYELALDKNFSMTLSGGLAFNSFSYSYTPKFGNIGLIPRDTLGNMDMYPSGSGDKLTRSFTSVMFLPQFDINLMTNPIRQTTILEFRLGLGAGIYLNKHKNVYGDVVEVHEKGNTLSYYYMESMEMGKGNTWASTYGSLYAGLRWRNTTSDFLNRSTLGIQVFMPFNNYRVGRTEITYRAVGWDQVFQTETAKFNLNTISLKYTFSFTPTSR